MTGCRPLSMLSAMEPTCYRIVVEGRLTERLLDRLLNVGLELVSVNSVDGPGAGS